MHPDLLYLLAVVSSIAYALILERVQRNPRRTYIHRWTWITVAIGVGLILGWAAARLAAGTPATTIPDTLWCAWQVMLLMSSCCGMPIIIWQMLTEFQALDEALDAAQERLG